MNDFESKLRAVRLQGPSPDLDRRMERLFEATQHVPIAARMRGRWWWALGVPAAAAIALYLGVGLLTAPQPALPPAPIVHQIEPAGLMRELLLLPSAKDAPAPPFELSVHL